MLRKDHPRENPLFIVGASARAAAFSARRAGFAPLAIDLFADLDLAAVAETSVARDYPRGIAALARQLPPAPFIFTGGLENHPALVDQLATGRKLYGNRGEVLRRVRDPYQVARALAESGQAVPEVAKQPDTLPRDGTWLKKPLRGSSGLRIAPWDQESEQHGLVANDYFQRRMEGSSQSGIFVAADGRARLLGVSRQLIGAGWAGAAPFRYAGSIGPLSLSDGIRSQWERIGDCLARKFQLAGLFGVDAIEGNRQIWPVEVNPRYAASVEVLERALSIPCVGWHAEACRHAKLPDHVPLDAPVCCGKAILYSPHDVTVPEQLVDRFLAENTAEGWPRFADIPAAGTPISRGMPMMTVLAAAETQVEVERLLRDRIAEIRQRLPGP